MMTVIMFLKLAWERMARAIFLFQLRKSGTPAGVHKTFHYSLEPRPAAAKKAFSVCRPAGPAMASAF